MRGDIRGCVVGVLTLVPMLAWAAGGTVSGKVDAAPAKYLEETVVSIKEAKGNAPPKTVQMDQKGMKFLPHVLAISVGDTVEFLNHDGVDHNVFTPDGETYNLGMVKANAKGSYTFKKAGTYTQLCSVHPEMLGFVVVTPNPYHAAVDAQGNFKIEHVPAGSYTLTIWNSHLKAADQTVTVVEGKSVEVSFSLKR
jgi:plastocyanin